MRTGSTLLKGEGGQALIYVTLVLVLTMIVIPPLLTFMGGAGRSAQIREDRMLQLYAADAGIEDGFFRITKGNLTELPWSGNISDLNGHDVSISIEQEAGGIYKITSTATNYAGNELTVESYAASLDYSYLFNNAISSYGDITLKSGVEVYGNITLNSELDNKGDVYGNTSYGVPGWPTEDEMKLFYGNVTLLPSYGFGAIEIDRDDAMGPLYRAGDLDIYCSNESATLTILDTFYVTGDLDIGQTDKDFYLNLNGQTIFCEGGIDLGGKCTLTGSGVIVAIGDVFFSPKVLMEEDGDDFIFVMSVSGNLQAQPMGDFYGAMAGLVEVQYQPNSTITWREMAFDPNFPDGDLVAGIRSYIIRN